MRSRRADRIEISEFPVSSSSKRRGRAHLSPSRSLKVATLDGGSFRGAEKPHTGRFSIGRRSIVSLVLPVCFALFSRSLFLFQLDRSVGSCPSRPSLSYFSSSFGARMSPSLFSKLGVVYFGRIVAWPPVLRCGTRRNISGYQIRERILHP